MNILGIRQDLTRTRRRGVVQGSKRRGLNPQGSRTIEKILEGAFLLEVYISKISPLKVEINLLIQSQKIPIT